MPETDFHRILMGTLIDTLCEYFLAQQDVYVSGNLLVFYMPSNKFKHVSPDVFYVKGVEKRRRRNYLIWEEGPGPQAVIELISAGKRVNHEQTKLELYRDVLKVQEYYLFNPDEDFTGTRLTGIRRRQGDYRPIRPIAGRLPSRVMGLHLETSGTTLRLWEPGTGAWLPTLQERAGRADLAGNRAHQAEQEVERLRKLVEELTRKNGPMS